MAILLPDARELSDDVLEAAPVACLARVRAGPHRSPSRWPPRCRPRDRLSLVGRLRRPRRARFATAPLRGARWVRAAALSDAQAEHLQQLVRTHQPEELGIAAPLWTRRAVRDLIRKEFDLDLAERTVGRYLSRWGFTAKRPRRHARDQDPEEVRQWLEETYPAIEARANREGAEIHWGDEVGVAANQQPARGYARRGGKPRPRMCRTRTSERTKSRRSRTTARFGS